MTDDRDLLTVSQAADALGASSQTIRNWIRAQRLEGDRIGHRFLIPHVNVERLRAGSSSRAMGESPWDVDADEPVSLPRATTATDQAVDPVLGG